MTNDLYQFLQVHYSYVRTEPSQAQFVPVSAATAGATPLDSGGLWTSSFHPTQISAFSTFMRLRESGEPTAFWLLFMDTRSRIYRIDSARAARAFVRAYQDDATEIAWGRVAADWDAVWLTESGVDACIHMDDVFPFVDWDTESTFWLRWQVVAVQPLVPPDMETDATRFFRRRAGTRRRRR